MTKLHNNRGVYEIRNTLTGKKYIGSSKHLSQREGDHWNNLERGSHDHRELQKDYDVLGLKNFIFGVLEYVNRVDQLTIREQFYIHKYGLQNLYNERNAASTTRIDFKAPTQKKKWNKNKDENERQLRAKFESPIIWDHLKIVIQFSLDDKIIAIHKDPSKQIYEICRHYSSYKKRFTPKKFKNSRWAYLNFVVMCNICKCEQPLEIYSNVFLCTVCGHSDTYTINALHNVEKYKLTFL